MLDKAVASFVKEFLLLIRDRGGLAMLFLMPVALIIIMSLIQDAPFRDYQEAQIPLVFVNDDRGEIGTVIEKGLQNLRIFSINKTINGSSATEETAVHSVSGGKYKIAVIIPSGVSETVHRNSEIMVKRALADMGLVDDSTENKNMDSARIKIFFDPAAKHSLKTAVKGSLEKYASKLETRHILKSLNEQLNEVAEEKVELSLPEEGFIQISEISSGNSEREMLFSNSVQHNVPAWTIFAMFFIVIPLASNIIKERESGVLARLKTLPGSFSIQISGKFAVYFLVCFAQLIFMLAVGVFVLPLLGLSKLELGSGIVALTVISVCIAFAAIGYGLLVGTLFNTHQQAAVFGSISVVIMAALGGIWVPSYVMPEMMQKVGKLSPMNWGLEAFNDLFLRGGGIYEIIFESLLLIGFFLLVSLIAFVYNRFTRGY